MFACSQFTYAPLVKLFIDYSQGGRALMQLALESGNTMNLSATQRDRKKYLGSNDISAICGLNKYKSILDVFNEKVGLSETTQNEAMQMGLLLEPVILNLAEERLNLKIVAQQAFAYHPEYCFLGGTADALTECDSIIEAKNSRFGSGYDADNIPTEHMVQCQWMMGLHKKKKTYLCVLVGGQQFKHYVIHYDESKFHKLATIAFHFWMNHVLMLNPPIIHPPKTLSSQEQATEESVFVKYIMIKRLKDTIDIDTKKLADLRTEFDDMTRHKDIISYNNKTIARRTHGKRKKINEEKLKEDLKDKFSEFVSYSEYSTLTFY